jgi:hypothetical protein
METVTDRTGCHTAQFATRWLQPTAAVIAAHGELDASNAHAHSLTMRCGTPAVSAASC